MRESTQDVLVALNTIFDPQRGTEISWSALEEVLAPIRRNDRRFSTIYRAWMRHLLAWKNLVMVAVPGKGLRVLYEHERTEDAKEAVGKSFRFIVAGKDKADAIEIAQLTQDQREYANHYRYRIHMLHRAVTEERIHFAPSPRPAAPPRPMPPVVREGFRPSPTEGTAPRLVDGNGGAED